MAMSRWKLYVSHAVPNLKVTAILKKISLGLSTTDAAEAVQIFPFFKILLSSGSRQDINLTK
jgi:hypothetical protein